ncbi:MAG: hypothetical protein ACREMK_08560 [Gemmatimonadota bacterium]
MPDARSRNSKLAKSIARRYEKPAMRVDALSHLVDILPGVLDPLDNPVHDVLVGRQEWESYDTRRRNRAVGFLPRDYLAGRHMLRPPIVFTPSPRTALVEEDQAAAIGSAKVVFRYRDVPLAALAGKSDVPVTPLLGLVPRLKATSTEDLAVILNSRLFHFYWQRYFPRRVGQPVTPAAERLAGFRVPILTKKGGAAFRKARDEILRLAAENAERLNAVDQVDRIAEEAGVDLVPLAQTEGIIREINVPRPLGEVADVRRRGPVVIFRRGSTIVTTTEEAATYLELWLQQRFDRLRGMGREELEDYIRMPLSTAHVVVILQHRARLESEIAHVQGRIDALQREAEGHLYDAYGLGEEEREHLRSFA